MKKKTIFISLFLSILAAAGIWYFVFRDKKKPVVVQTVHPVYGYISELVTVSGKIQPVDTVSIGSQVSGTIKYLHTDFNSKVKKGQLIVELDKSLLRAQADQYSGNLKVAKSQLVYDKSNYDRQNELFNIGAISKANYETALYQYNSAMGNVNSVASQLQGAEKNLSYANIYSPINGTVLVRQISVGQTIASSFNTPTLFILAKDLTKMQVQAAVDEADIGNVKTGLRVSFTVDAFANNVFNGIVEEVRLQTTVSHLLRIAIRALQHTKMRAFLTMLGIIIGVGAVIAMVAIGEGSKASIQKQIAAMGSNMITIRANSNVAGGVRLSSSSVQTLTLSDVEELLKKGQFILGVSPAVSAKGQVINGASTGLLPFRELVPLFLA